MKILLFFSRIALICNICFVLVEIMRYIRNLQVNTLYQIAIVLGAVSPFLNLALTVMLFSVLLGKKSILAGIPRWLLITNFLFLIVQLVVMAGKPY